MKTNNLIDRQAAIDFIDAGRLVNPNEPRWSDNEVVAFLKSRPSAQPDGIPLEWIDKHLEWLDNCDNDFAQLAKISIRAMVELWKKDRI